MSEKTNDANPANRTKTGRFKKGKSGNPNGRPKKDSVFLDLCKEHTPAMFKRLLALAQNPDHKDHFRAIEKIIAYAEGQPRQAIEHGGIDGEPITFVYTPPATSRKEWVKNVQEFFDGQDAE